MAPAVLTCIPGTIPVHVPIPMPIKHAKTKSNISFTPLIILLIQAVSIQ